ncbi:MAG: tRNA 2-thiouridine(34) synthase MnmA, partial [Lachnospiraceae bacterium]|nr:tRNA 2-thiouridine(34) synthase MnmA [Lachnospiraceae bacterium]
GRGAEPGNFVLENGEIIGKHRGIIHYTVGQRRGLGIAAGRRIFVKEIRPDTNEVVLSDNDALFTDRVIIRNISFMSVEDLDPGKGCASSVKIRYNHKGEAAEILKTGDDEITIDFEKPVRAAAPGQSAVCYDEDGCIICGGIIQ